MKKTFSQSLGVEWKVFFVTRQEVQRRFEMEKVKGFFRKKMNVEGLKGY